MITNTLFFRASHICPLPSVLLLHVLVPFFCCHSASCWGCDKWASEVMFVGPSCSRPNSTGHISHPFWRKVKYSSAEIGIFLIVEWGVCAWPDLGLLCWRKTHFSLIYSKSFKMICALMWLIKVTNPLPSPSFRNYVILSEGRFWASLSCFCRAVCF